MARQMYAIPPEEDGVRMSFSRVDEFLFKHVPFLWVRWVLWQKGVHPRLLQLDRLLRKYKKVHVRIHQSRRGFRLELDNQVSLWFEQDGDNFEYDGWEAGPYEDGNVRLFEDCVGDG